MNLRNWKKLCLVLILLTFFILIKVFQSKISVHFRYYLALVSFPTCRTPVVNVEKCQFGDNNRRLNAIERINNVTIFYRNQNTKLERCSLITGRRILISFASSCCEKSQVVNCKTALEVGGFDVCVLFGPDSIDPGFKQRHIEPMLKLNLTGYGFWVWKPYIILKTLLEMNDDDFLFYADAGSEFINNVDTGIMCPQRKLERDVVLFHLGTLEKAFTKADAFVITGCNRPSCRNTDQILASFLSLRRSITTIQFVTAWLTYSTDPRAVSDLPSVLTKDSPLLVAHRHDQSLLSLVAKNWGYAEQALPDPSQYGKGARKAFKVTHGFVNHQYILHTRIKT